MATVKEGEKARWSKTNYLGVGSAFYRRSTRMWVPPSWFTGPLCNICIQLTAVSAWNADSCGTQLTVKYAHLHVLFAYSQSEFQRSLQLTGNVRADFFLLTETKYKIFIPRKETVRATGKKKSSAFRTWMALVPWFLKGSFIYSHE